MWRALSGWRRFSFTLSFFGPRYIPDRITLTWIDSQLTPANYLAIVTLLIGAHFLSRYADRNLESMISATRLSRRFRSMDAGFLASPPGNRQG
jgi:hypothetical protein